MVELISGGAQIAVNNENKVHYLNLLAQYRLASQVREEVEHFLKGTWREDAPQRRSWTAVRPAVHTGSDPTAHVY